MRRKAFPTLFRFTYLLLWAVTIYVGWWRQVSLPVITTNGYPASLALAPGHCLGTRLPKKRYLAVTSVCHATGKTDLPRLVLMSKTPLISPKSSVFTMVWAHFGFIMNSLPEGLGNVGPYFCKSPGIKNASPSLVSRVLLRLQDTSKAETKN